MGNRGVIQAGVSTGDLLTLFLNDVPDQTTSIYKETRTQKAQPSQYIDNINVITANNKEDLEAYLEFIKFCLIPSTNYTQLFIW